MEKYSLVLRNDRTRQYDRIALFIIILNLAIFLYLTFFSIERAIRIAALLGVVLIGIVLAIQYFLVRIKHQKDSPYIYGGLFIAFITWFQIGNAWASVICFMLELLYQAARRQLAVNFYHDRIVLTSFPKKTIRWKALNSVILKDGMLTLDFKSNKIIQAEIVNSPWDVDEQKFNEFCTQQLQSAVSTA